MNILWAHTGRRPQINLPARDIEGISYDFRIFRRSFPEISDPLSAIITDVKTDPVTKRIRAGQFKGDPGKNRDPQSFPEGSYTIVSVGPAEIRVRK